MRSGLFLLCFMLLLLPMSVKAAEYDNIFISARALSMGQAQTAVADDHGAIYYNPAAMTNVAEGTLAYLTILYGHRSWINTELETSLAGDGEMDMPRDIISPIPGVITNFGVEGLRAGLALFGLTGFAAFYDPEEGPTRFALQESVLVNSSLSPSFAYRITDWLSVGFAVNLFIFKKFLNVVSFGDPATGLKLGEIRLESDTNYNTHLFPTESVEAGVEDVGFNLGFLIKPLDFLSLGIDYQEKVKFKYEGDYERTAFSPFPGFRAPAFRTGFETFVTSPRKLLFGIGLNPIKALTLAFDIQYTFWKEIDEFVVRLDSPDLFIPTYQSGRSVMETGFEDTVSYRVGVAYTIPTPCNFTIRAGYHRDNAPAPEEYYMPGRTSDLNVYSLGFTFNVIKSLAIDLVGVYGDYENLEVEGSKNKTPFGVLFGDMRTDDYFYNAGIQFSYKF